MKEIIIAMYEKNMSEIFAYQNETPLFPLRNEDSLDYYIEKLKTAIRKGSYILCDEQGGIPYVSALIASANSESIIVSDVNKDNIGMIIDAIHSGTDLSIFLDENKICDSLKVQS